MPPKFPVSRKTVDLGAFPDLVVIYLGMKARSLRGLLTVLRFGPRISQSVAAAPEGLLLHEQLLYSLFPLHEGMRQYWRNFDSLEAWARSVPHQKWWQDFMRDPGGTGFWHETYFMRGGAEAVFDDIEPAVGLARFAPVLPAEGAMFSARQRVRHKEGGAK
jgi:hypothetical protein